MTTNLVITLTALAAAALGFLSCSLQRKTVSKPAGEVKKVAYGDKILLHMHPEKVLNYLPDLEDVQIAYLYGMSLEEYQSAKKTYDSQAKEAASDLLKDPEFAEKVNNLPFKKDETILVIGESTADALNSWVYILKYLLEQRKPQENIRVINAAISGQTTTEALKRITTQVKGNPDWVLCHLGANDCMRYGNADNKTNVAIAETLSNLNTISNIVSTETKAKFIWMAPAPVNENKTSSFPPFKQMKLTIANNDLMAVADKLKQNYPNVIDFRDGLGVPAKSQYVQFDGGHLTIEGQSVIVKTLVNSLAVR